MKKLLLLAFWLSAPLGTFAAFVDHYVSALAATYQAYTYAQAIQVAATSMTTNGTVYTILTPGNTVWTSFGAANNNAGTVFTMANQPGTGTGVAYQSTTLALAIAGAVSGDRVNIRNDGAHASRAANGDAPAGGSLTTPTWYRGYMTTPGDGWLGRATNTSTLTTTNMPTITYTGGHMSLSAHTLIDCLQITGASTIATLYMNAADTRLQHSVITNTYAGAAAAAVEVTGGGQQLIFDCDLYQTDGTNGTSVLLASGGSPTLNGSHLYSSSSGNTASAAGITCSSNVNVLNTEIISTGGVAGSNPTYGINLSAIGATLIADHATIVGFYDSIKQITGATASQVVTNSLLTDYGASGFAIENTSTANAWYVAYTRYRQNVSGGTNTYDSGNASDWFAASNVGNVNTSLSASDYTTPASFANLQLLTGSPAYGVAAPFYSAGIGNSGSMGAVATPASSGGGGEVDSAYVK